MQNWMQLCRDRKQMKQRLRFSWNSVSPKHVHARLWKHVTMTAIKQLNGPCRLAQGLPIHRELLVPKATALRGEDPQPAAHRRLQLQRETTITVLSVCLDQRSLQSYLVVTNACASTVGIKQRVRCAACLYSRR